MDFLLETFYDHFSDEILSVRNLSKIFTYRRILGVTNGFWPSKLRFFVVIVGYEAGWECGGKAPAECGLT